MVKVVRKLRKSAVLTPSQIPCLRSLPTINITKGCALGCTYCYIQGYSDYPGSDRVILYENTAELLARELERKRKKPRRVYFSPSSDAFQYLPEVQEVSLQTMSILLRAGVEVAFLTKGFITEPFRQLFARTPELVFAQVGITTLDRSLWQTFEPRTAPPGGRIDTIVALTKLGVRTVARLDPLIPDITDTDENLAPLLDALQKAGVTAAVASHVFVRPGVTREVADMLQPDSTHGSRPRIEPWPFMELDDGAETPRKGKYEKRCRRFERVRLAGEAFGITIRPCRCKNPLLGGVGCEIAGPTSVAPSESKSQGLLDFA